jgi:mannosyl-3-phosphoglycerate phosphatase
MKKIVIFTDLDGTLLDEADYSHAGALPALGVIADSGIPLIFCSSKTRAELETYRSRLGNLHPFIAENGGGIFIPHGYFSIPFEAEESHGYHLIRLGTPYAEIRKQFVQLREQMHVKARGFADMTVAEVAQLTGLKEDEAVLARQRDFDEAFVFEGATDEAFLRAIEAAGLNWTQGRIFHIMGRHDKGRAVSMLISLYQLQYGDVASIALGDSLNDLPMLQAVDTPVLVKHNDGRYDERTAIPNLVMTRLPGPSGWNETVLELTGHKQ